MAKRLQHRGGTTAQHSTFTGAVREVTVDTDKNTLVVHDGATAGGHPLATATNFTSTGIDDNATSTAITIDNLERVGIGTASILKPLHLRKDNAGNSETLLLLHNNNSTDGTEVEIRLAPTTYPRDIGNVEDGGVARWSSIRATRDGAGNGTTMSFLTNQGGATPTERIRINSFGNVGIGTSSPSSALDIIGGLTVDGNDNNIQHDITRQTGATNASRPVIRLISKNTASDVTDGFGSAIQFRMKDDTADIELGAIGYIRDGADGSGAFAVGQDSQLLQSFPQFIVKSSGNVGIGTSSPNGILELKSTGNTNFFITAGNTSASQVVLGDTDDIDVGKITYSHNINSMEFIVNASEAMRIDSSGNLLLDKTTTSNTTAGVRLGVGGVVAPSRTSDAPIVASRLSTDGRILELRKDATLVGDIGSYSDDLFISGNVAGHSGLRFMTSSRIAPCSSSGSVTDNVSDLGYTSNRFKDLYLGGGLYVGGTGTANKLDDYEEGTHTPTVTPETSGTLAFGTGSTVMSYIKIGHRVFVNGYLLFSTVSSAVGNSFSITLPFAIKTGLSSDSEWGGGGINFYDISTTTSYVKPFIFSAGNSFFTVYMNLATELSANDRISFSFSYQSA